MKYLPNCWSNANPSPAAASKLSTRDILIWSSKGKQRKMAARSKTLKRISAQMRNGQSKLTWTKPFGKWQMMSRRFKENEHFWMAAAVLQMSWLSFSICAWHWRDLALYVSYAGIPANSRSRNILAFFRSFTRFLFINSDHHPDNISPEDLNIPDHHP